MNQKLAWSLTSVLSLVAVRAFAQAPAPTCGTPDCHPHVEAKAVVNRLVEKKEPTCECTTIKLWKPEIKEVAGCKWVDVEICREVDDGCCAPGCCNHPKRLVIQVIPVKKEYRYRVLTFKSEEIDVPKAASIFECGPPETVTTKIPVPCADGGQLPVLPK
jgi:hypothetical protein